MTEGLGDKTLQRWGGYVGQAMAFHQKENGDCFTYVTLSVGGLKSEGQPMESRPTASSAAEALDDEIGYYLGTAKPIWRQFPEVTQDGEQFYATARLVRDL